MMKRFMLVWVVILGSAARVLAQDNVVWVQIEAQPTLNSALERARDYSGDLPDVNAFSLGNGWYGIALGPYNRSDADQVLRVYRSEGVIPRDSYIALASSFRQQIWPVGANVLGRGVIEAPVTTEQAPAVIGNVPAPPPADETPAQAQRSERALLRSERETLQTALKWAGVYVGAIDGAFGRGTRNAMAAWQDQKGFDVTGILTTEQRVALLKDYNSVLDDLGLRTVRDEEAGIEMLMPMDVVAFEKYEYPFVHYTSTGDIPAKVLMISQEGDQDTLFGLYDIMQTLDIVPVDGPRERKDTSFILIGEDAMRISETRVSLEDGQIKGFTLVWPAGDEERRRRLITEMETSFSRQPGVIPLGAGSDEQAIDLVAGLKIRTPRLSRSGFFVDSRGTVITTSEAVENCGRITLDGEIDAELTVLNTDKGVAIVRPSVALSPLGIARFSAAQPRLNSEVAASGYSFEGVLGAPTMTFGSLSDVRGLAGEPDVKRLALNTLPGDAGGPVLDDGGGVFGMLLPNPDTGRALPDGVSFALDRETLQAVLAEAGMAGASTNSETPIDPFDLSTAATGMTVLVSCWK